MTDSEWPGPDFPGPHCPGTFGLNERDAKHLWELEAVVSKKITAITKNVGWGFHISYSGVHCTFSFGPVCGEFVVASSQFESSLYGRNAEFTRQFDAKLTSRVEEAIREIAYRFFYVRPKERTVLETRISERQEHFR